MSSPSLVACQCKCPAQIELKAKVAEDATCIYYRSVDMRCTTFCVGDNVLIKRKALNATKPLDSKPTPQPSLKSTPSSTHTPRSRLSLDHRYGAERMDIPDDDLVRQRRINTPLTIRNRSQLAQQLLENHLSQQGSQNELRFDLGEDSNTDSHISPHQPPQSSSQHTQLRKPRVKSGDELLFEHFRSQLHRKKRQQQHPVSTIAKSSDSTFFGLKSFLPGDSDEEEDEYISLNNQNNSNNLQTFDNNLNSHQIPSDRVKASNLQKPLHDAHSDNSETDSDLESHASQLQLTFPTLNSTKPQSPHHAFGTAEQAKSPLANPPNILQTRSNNTTTPHYMSANHSTFFSPDQYQLGKICGLLEERASGLQFVIYSLYRYDNEHYVIQTDLRVVTNAFNIVDHAFILTHQDFNMAPPAPSIFSLKPNGHVHAHNHVCSTPQQPQQVESPPNTRPSQLAQTNPPSQPLLSSTSANNDTQYHTRQVFVCQYLQHGTDPTLIPIISANVSDSSFLASNSQFAINTSESLRASLNAKVQQYNTGNVLKLTTPLSDLQKLKAYCRFVDLKFDIKAFYLSQSVLNTIKSQLGEAEMASIIQDPTLSSLNHVPSAQLHHEPSLLGLYKKALEPGYIGVALGAPLHERISEFKTIYEFLLHGIGKRKAGGTLLISGLPGTGKTASMTQAINRLEYEAKHNLVQQHSVVRINATQLRDPQQIYPLLLQGLTMTHELGFFIAKHCTPKQALAILIHLTNQRVTKSKKPIPKTISQHDFDSSEDDDDGDNDDNNNNRDDGGGVKSKSSKHSLAEIMRRVNVGTVRRDDRLFAITSAMSSVSELEKYRDEILRSITPTSITADMLEHCIFIVDEADYMITSHQKELYQLLDFPAHESLPLTVLLISNTFSLWEKSLRILSRVGLKQLSFDSYTTSNIQAIIKARLNAANQQFTYNLMAWFRAQVEQGIPIDQDLMNYALDDIISEKRQQQRQSLLEYQHYLESTPNSEPDQNALLQLTSPITRDNVNFTTDELIISLTTAKYKQSHRVIGLDDDAIRFTAMRVSQLSGDCRRALDIAAKAISIASANRLSSTEKIRVTIDTIVEAVRNTQRSAATTYISQLSKTDLLLLSALTLLTVSFTFRTKKVANLHYRNYISIRELFRMYTQLLTRLELFGHPHYPANLSSSTQLLQSVSSRIHSPPETLILPSLHAISALGVVGVECLSKINTYVVFWTNSMKDETVNFISQLSFMAEFIKEANFTVIYEAEVIDGGDGQDSIFAPSQQAIINQQREAAVSNSNTAASSHDATATSPAVPVKRGRGRPRKDSLLPTSNSTSKAQKQSSTSQIDTKFLDSLDSTDEEDVNTNKVRQSEESKVGEEEKEMGAQPVVKPLKLKVLDQKPAKTKSTRLLATKAKEAGPATTQLVANRSNQSVIQLPTSELKQPAAPTQLITKEPQATTLSTAQRATKELNEPIPAIKASIIPIPLELDPKPIHIKETEPLSTKKLSLLPYPAQPRPTTPPTSKQTPSAVNSSPPQRFTTLPYAKAMSTPKVLPTTLNYTSNNIPTTLNLTNNRPVLDTSDIEERKTRHKGLRNIKRHKPNTRSSSRHGGDGDNSIDAHDQQFVQLPPPTQVDHSPTTTATTTATIIIDPPDPTVPRRRGRPPKPKVEPEFPVEAVPKRGRGRPRVHFK